MCLLAAGWRKGQPHMDHQSFLDILIWKQVILKGSHKLNPFSIQTPETLTKYCNSQLSVVITCSLHHAMYK